MLYCWKRVIAAFFLIKTAFPVSLFFEIEKRNRERREKEKREREKKEKRKKRERGVSPTFNSLSLKIKKKTLSSKNSLKRIFFLF